MNEGAAADTTQKPLSLIIGAAYILDESLKDMKDYRTLIFFLQSSVRINNALVDIFFALESPEVNQHLKRKTNRMIGEAIENCTPDIRFLVEWLSRALEEKYYLSSSDIKNVIDKTTAMNRKIKDLKYIHGIADHEMYRIGPQLKRFSLEKHFEIISKSVTAILNYKPEES